MRDFIIRSTDIKSFDFQIESFSVDFSSANAPANKTADENADDHTALLASCAVDEEEISREPNGSKETVNSTPHKVRAQVSVSENENFTPRMAAVQLSDTSDADTSHTESGTVKGGATKGAIKLQRLGNRNEIRGDRSVFRNSGSTCYMGSLLQSLFHSDRALTLIRNHFPCSRCRKPAFICIACLLQAAEKNSRDAGSVCGTDVMKDFCERVGRAWNRQQDAADLLRVILTNLQETVPNEYGKWEQQCHWDEEVKLAKLGDCPGKCRDESTKTNRHCFATFTITNAKDDCHVASLFADAHSAESINDSVGICNVCKAPVSRSTSTSWLLHGPLAILHLNRGVDRRTKSERKVDFDEDSFCGKKSYILKSVIVHTGGVDFGHYVCWTRCDGGWYLFNDERVTFEETIGAHVFCLWTLLVYEMREEDHPMPSADVISIGSDIDSSGAEEVHQGENVKTESAPTCGKLAERSHESDDLVLTGAEDGGISGDGTKCKEIYLDEINDGGALFDEHVTQLLQTFERGEDCKAFLRSLPAYSHGSEESSIEEALSSFRAGLASLVDPYVGSKQAVEVNVALYKCHIYPLVVLCDAMSRTTSMPTSFYLDSFLAFFSSLLHKDVSADISGFASRSRYWVVGTAEPGSGKSPAMNPLRDVLFHVLAELEDFAPGSKSNRFHVQEGTTHWVALNRLKEALSYLLIASAEAGPMLCPSWPSNATWNQATHINYQRFLDAANGGPIPWETKNDRASVGKDDDIEEGAESTGGFDRTNVTIAFFQQLKWFALWWAKSEASFHVGLASRFLFMFGMSAPPGHPKYRDFNTTVAFPIFDKLFRRILKLMGHRIPMTEGHPLHEWTTSDTMHDFVYQLRTMCHDFSKHAKMGGICVDGLNKCSYWMAQVALTNAILQQLLPNVLGRHGVEEDLTPKLTFASLRAASEFFWRRYLFGLSVLDVDIGEQAWMQGRPGRMKVLTSNNVLAARLLRGCGSNLIYMECLRRLGHPFRRLVDGTEKERLNSIARVIRIFEYLQLMGVGRIIQAASHVGGVAFQKLQYKSMTGMAQRYVKKLKVPRFQFGLEITTDGESNSEPESETEHNDPENDDKSDSCSKRKRIESRRKPSLLGPSVSGPSVSSLHNASEAFRAKAHAFSVDASVPAEQSGTVIGSATPSLPPAPQTSDKTAQAHPVDVAPQQSGTAIGSATPSLQQTAQAHLVDATEPAKQSATDIASATLSSPAKFSASRIPCAAPSSSHQQRKRKPSRVHVKQDEGGHENEDLSGKRRKQEQRPRLKCEGIDRLSKVKQDVSVKAEIVDVSSGEDTRKRRAGSGYNTISTATTFFTGSIKGLLPGREELLSRLRNALRHIEMYVFLKVSSQF